MFYQVFVSILSAPMLENAVERKKAACSKKERFVE